MSHYEYFCDICDTIKDDFAPIGTGTRLKECPTCHTLLGDKFYRLFNPLVPGKGFIPINTFAQQSDINKERLRNTKEGQEWLERKEAEAQKRQGVGRKVLEQKIKELKQEMKDVNTN